MTTHSFVTLLSALAVPGLLILFILIQYHQNQVQQKAQHQKQEALAQARETLRNPYHY
jgi:hypothetical protein